MFFFWPNVILSYWIMSIFLLFSFLLSTITSLHLSKYPLIAFFSITLLLCPFPLNYIRVQLFLVPLCSFELFFFGGCHFGALWIYGFSGYSLGTCLKPWTSFSPGDFLFNFPVPLPLYFYIIIIQCAPFIAYHAHRGDVSLMDFAHLYK